ncbi:UDP-3-O-acyl-N-acetylglucosamine deacetylase [Anabaena sp. UHCC 0204]|uniref:UDP-3-O-acyl-N-acetylglucosamine deacetylase n=1 Tax=Anabaena sp. UHCC 0204 TaxID=2590009 RepID=UPI001447EBAA|nr:UDP-3-O-acyl-N-acetylglucosamine deacetylase [Anabaena sp. UHCC 0204]MTJ06987.1 UDP-3-O-acyl-N-acetylglucosamine deacetylase [Anabaena sp. UHCC 0204]
MQQHTLAGEISQTGVGLHSGVKTQVRILPAPPGSDTYGDRSGRFFVRVDLPNSPIIPAQVGAVSQTVLSTQLGKDEVCVRTVEHLLAALAAMGVDNARIEIDGPEVPLLDGSAQIWCERIAEVGLVSQTTNNSPKSWVITEPIWIYQGDAFVCALPAPETRFSYGIDFNLPAIGNQWHSWLLTTNLEISSADFATEIAPARTFGLQHQIEHLQKSGLIKGGSLDNALVCGDKGWLNPPLRFANEPVRHKILDLVGDLSLLGNFPIAHFLAYKASHNLHIQLAQKILDVSFLKMTEGLI